jgi:rhodanese-related sulfurtransferase
MSLVDKLFGRTTAEPVKWLETNELAELLSNSSPPLLIDVRGPGEFTGALGHIETAENIPLDELPAHTARLLEAHRPLVLICHTDRRSAAAAAHITRAGGTEVAVLRGGMVAWRSSRS